MDNGDSRSDPYGDRAQLFDALSNLSSADFERLLVGINMPRMNRAGAAAKIGEQVSALLEWADSKIGPGLDAIARHLAELNRFESDAYLRSLVTTYEKWWEHYTITDAVGKVEQSLPGQPSIFDFGLMVQTVTKEQEPTDPENNPRQQDKEKTERLPVLEDIRKYADDHVLLVGRPGSGKSTALIRLLLEEAALSPGPSPKLGRGGQERTAVLVELRYWQASVLERIRAFLYQHDPHLNLDDAALHTLLRQGRFLLLIDGLNELPSDEARTQLTTFRREHPKVPMIFTTRDLGLGGDLGIEKKLEMQPLTEAQMKDFIRAYVPDQAEAMLRQLNNRLREFGQTPLLLWMLCEVFQQSPNRQMPTNLAEVFRAFTTMYEDSSLRKHEVALLKGDVRPLSDRRLWKDALKALAALMMQGETPVDFRVAIHRTEAERELGKIFTNEKFPVRNILDDLLKYHLLQNRTTNQLEFRHQLIQEYYAAEHLLCLLPELSDEQLKHDYLNFLKWTESIALTLALVDDEAQALRVVKVAINDVDILLGARLTGKVKPTFQATAIGFVNTLIESTKLSPFLQIDLWTLALSEFTIPKLIKILKNPDRDVYRMAVEVLCRLEYEFSIPALLDVLKDSRPDIRRSVAWSLGKSTSEAAIPGLLKALKDDDNYVRRHAAWALGKYTSEAAVLGLLKALEDDDNYIRQYAAEALGKLRSEAAIPGLLKALKDGDSNLCQYAAEALGKLRSEAAIPGLLKALEYQNYLGRKYAAEALVKLGSEAVIPSLIKALEDGDNNVRQNAAEALGMLGSEAAIPGLLKALEDSDNNVRQNAAEALVKLGSQAVIPGLIRALKDDDNSVRYNAAEALGKLGSEAAIPGLIRALEDDDNFVRYNAAEALGKLGSEAAITGLLKALEDGDSYLCHYAAEALGKLGSEAAIPGLLKALKYPNNNARKFAAEALVKLGSKTAIPGLLKALEDKDYGVCGPITKALVELGGEAAIPSLLKALEGQNNNVRYHAAEALGNLGSEAAIPGLLKALKDKNHSVRYHAAEALGNLGSEAAIPDLLKALKDKNYSVRCFVAEALGKLGSEAAIPSLLKILEDGHYSIRWRAAKALEKLGSERAIPGLLKALENQNSNVRWDATKVLETLSSPVSLTHLWRLQLQRRDEDLKGLDELKKLACTIQNRCKFYNYEIWQAYLASQQSENTHSQIDKTIVNTVTIQTVEKLTIMSDKAPIFNQQHATIGVNYAAEGSQQDFTQHIHAPEQNFEILLTGYKHFIHELQQQNPHLADETAIIQTIDTEARRIDTRWQNFLNLQRLWNGSKKAVIKVGEHFVESNPWGKGAIAFLEGVSEDVK